MSAFVVQDQTINNIVNWLCMSERGRWNHTWLSRETNLDFSDYQAVGQALFDMNVFAVEARYGQGEAKEFRPLDYQHKIAFHENLIQSYKSLQCLLYQCSEGDIPETPLYKAMTELKQIIADEIIGNMAEYNKAKWD
jgi:hypothetical protein